MISKIDLLFQLLRSELQGKPEPKPLLKALTAKGFKDMYKLADRQSVTGMFCSALIHNNIHLPKVEAVRSLFLVDNTREENEKANNEVVALTELLKQHGIKFFVVKGQTLSCRYPYPLTRIVGDIDFYCDAVNFPKAKEVIQREWNVEFDEEDSESELHISFNHNEVLFEMHFRLCNFSSRQHQSLFESQLASAHIDHIRINEVEIPVLPPYLNIVYTFLHLWMHFVELGVGLRQFCDMAVLLREFHATATDSERKQLAKLLSDLGFARAFTAIEYILTNRLGLPKEYLPLPLNRFSSRYEKTILDVVFKRGNFGKYGRKTRVRSGLAYYIEATYIKLPTIPVSLFSHHVRIRRRCFATFPRKCYQQYSAQKTIRFESMQGNRVRF